MSTGMASRRGPIRHWCHVQASYAGHGTPLRPGEHHGELTRLSVPIRGLGRTAPVHPTLFLMRIPRYGPSWPRVILGCAGHLPDVRALTQAHSLGPGVVGGGMGLRRARQIPWPRGRLRRSPPKGRARRSPPQEVGRDAAQTQGSSEAEPAALGSGEAEPTASGSSKAEPAPRGRVRWSLCA